MNSLVCSRCGADIHAEAVHVDLGIARCTACSNVMDLRQPRVEQSLAQGPTRAALARGIPEKFHVTDTPDALRIRWRWFQADHVFTLFFCFAWNTFLVFWYSNLWGGDGPVNWMVVLFPLVHVAVGVWLTYYTLTGFLNHTTVDVVTTASSMPGRAYRDLERSGDAVLTVRHAPLPWRGNQRLSAASIRGFTTVEREVRRKQSSRWVYDVATLDADGRRHTLVKGLARDEADYLAQSLAERLKLPS